MNGLAEYVSFIVIVNVACACPCDAVRVSL